MEFGQDFFGLYRFSKISSEIRKAGISGCRKKRSKDGTFFDNRYKILLTRTKRVLTNPKETKGTPLYSKNALFTRNQKLDHSDIGSRRAFLSLLDVKGYPVAFIEGFKTA